MLAGRAVDAAGTIGCGAAPDALVSTGAVAVLARGRVDTARTVARRSAVSAFRAHLFSSKKITAKVKKKNDGCGEIFTNFSIDKHFYMPSARSRAGWSKNDNRNNFHSSLPE